MVRALPFLGRRPALLLRAMRPTTLRQAMGNAEKWGRAKWSHEKDVYDSVIVAAFGGLHVAGRVMDDDEEDEYPSASHETPTVRLHPVFPALVCFVLFQLQMTFLFSIDLDIPLRAGSEANRTGAAFIIPTWHALGDDDVSYSQLLLAVKGAMAFTLQMMSLSEFLLCLRPWLMVMNPMTWRCHKRLTTESSCMVTRACFSTGLLWLCCVAAKSMQLAVAFLACLMSLNVILAANEISYALFNGLVLLFVSKLDEHAFSFIAAVFHFDLHKYEEFTLELNDDHFLRLPLPESGHDRTLFNPCPVSPEMRKRLNYAYSALWKFGRLNRDVIIFCVLSTFYMWQLFIFLFTLDTGVLPRVRDMCSLLRARKHGGQYSQNVPSLGNPMVSQVIDMATVFIDLDSQLERLRHETVMVPGAASPASLEDTCFAPEPLRGIRRLSLENVFELCSQFPRVVALAILCLVTIFVLRYVLTLLLTPQLPLTPASSLRRHSSGLDSQTMGPHGPVSPGSPGSPTSPTPETPLMMAQSSRHSFGLPPSARARLPPLHELDVQSPRAEACASRADLEQQLKAVRARLLDLEKALQQSKAT